MFWELPIFQDSPPLGEVRERLPPELGIHLNKPPPLVPAYTTWELEGSMARLRIV
jgi:hypothetical protein